MKAIPFKCKFGHTLILKFIKGQETPSSIVCSDCEKREDLVTFKFGNAINSSYYIWFGKNKSINNDSEQVLAYRY